MLDNPGPDYQLTFVGCEPTCPPPCGPTNSDFILVGAIGIGNPIRQVSYYSNLFSCPPVCGTEVLTWNAAISDFNIFDFVNDHWIPSEPAIPLGQSVFVALLDNTNCCCKDCTTNASGQCTIRGDCEMNPVEIVTAVGGVLSLITQILPLVGVKNMDAIGAIVKTLTDIAPLITNQIGATYTGVKNIIDSVGAHPATTADQMIALKAFDKMVDDAWDAIEGQIDPDATA